MIPLTLQLFFKIVDVLKDFTKQLLILFNAHLHVKQTQLQIIMGYASAADSFYLHLMEYVLALQIQ